MMDTTPAHWPSFLHELSATEHAWNTRTVRYPADAVPMLPYSNPQFVSLLMEAVTVAPPGPGTPPGRFGPARFLDVGAGPGVKVRLAAALFGLSARGIDIIPEFCMEAQSHGANVLHADAWDYAHYAEAEIVFMNRPSKQMKSMEKHVMGEMQSGAVLMLVNAGTDPGREGWVPVTQEYGEPVVGCWIKP